MKNIKERIKEFLTRYRIWWFPSSDVSSLSFNTSKASGGTIGTPSHYPSSGYYPPSFKTNIYILTADKDSFESFLALDDSVDMKKNNYIFVERAADIKESANIKILDDFCLNPEIVEILRILNKGLYFNKLTGTTGVFASGTYVTVKTTNNSSGSSGIYP